MLKVVGAALILSAGVVMRRRLLFDGRREQKALFQLTQLLLHFSGEIRLLRRTMPQLLSRRGFGEYGDRFLADVASGAARDRDMAKSWCRAAENLPIAQREREELAALGGFFSADAASLSVHFSAAAQLLQQSAAKKQIEAQKREKLITALCFSGSLLLSILLI